MLQQFSVAYTLKNILYKGQDFQLFERNLLIYEAMLQAQLFLNIILNT